MYVNYIFPNVYSSKIISNFILFEKLFIFLKQKIKKKYKKTGIRDIAERAKVSIGPVDKVLNNRGGVSKATRERILKAIKELGYKPNILASRLKSAKEYTIAVIIPKGTRRIPFWHQYKEGFDKILKELHPFGLNIELHYFNQNNEKSFKKAVDKIIAGTYDGVFVVPIFVDETVRLVQYCQKKLIPVIFFNSNIDGQDNISYIGQNSFDSGYLAADLMDRCTHGAAALLIVTIVREDDNHLHFFDREKGFKHFFSNGDKIVLKYENNIGDDTLIENELLNFLKNKPEIGGIFVTNGINKVAPVISRLGANKYTLIGYDLTQDNINYLQNHVIDFLISQKPAKQAYNGIKLFYEYLILKQPILKSYYMPVDIVMRSNYEYYD